MADLIETKRKLRIIRELSSSFPSRTAEARLAQIEGIASGKIAAESPRWTPSPDLAERLKAGQESRSPRNAHDTRPAKPKADGEDEKKRKKSGGRNRQEGGGLNRSTDVNL